jgi:shikimate kinase
MIKTMNSRFPVASSIILLGMKHSGKSTLGRRLALRFGTDFFDLDEIIEELHDSDRRVSCREIFRAEGKSAFTALEAHAATILAERLTAGRAVAALGGGTIENPTALDALKNSGVKVYLKDTPEVLFGRIMAGGLPAFLSSDDPRAEFDSLYARRTVLYEREADLVVDVEGRGLDEAFSRLVARLEHSPIMMETHNARKHLR